MKQWNDLPQDRETLGTGVGLIPVGFFLLSTTAKSLRGRTILYPGVK